MKIDLHCHTKAIKKGDGRGRNVTPELFKSKIENADIKIKDKEGNEVTKGQIATGMTIEVNGQKVSTIIKAGDLDGNGKVNSIDSNIIKESRIGKRTLTEEEIKAADFNNDGRVNRIDAFILLYYRAQKIKDFSESTIKELMK